MTTGSKSLTDRPKALEAAKARERQLNKAAKFDLNYFVETMLKKIVGQDEIVHAIGKMLQTEFAKPKRNSPINMLLVGKTGLGKTTFANAMAEAVFPGSKLLEFNFAQHKSDHQFRPAFFGSASVWKGSGKGALSDALLADPQRVVFLDEVDKADKDVQQALLAPLDGEYEDEKLKVKIDLRRTVMVCAANWAHDQLEDLVAAEPDAGKRAGKVFAKLEEASVDPWLLGRFKAGIYVMRSPDQDTFLTIAERQLEDLAASFGLDLRYWSPQAAGETLAEIWKRRDQGVRAVETVINLEAYAHFFREIQEELETDPEDLATWVAIRIDEYGDDGYAISPFEETASDDDEEVSEQTLAEE
jgi:ATP-dependent Clp protease ATP-binding subunit ClpA